MSVVAAYQRLCEWDSLRGCHVSLDRDRTGDEYVEVVSDWIEAPVLTDLLALARECGLTLTAIGGGVRLDKPDNAMVAAVEQVKDILDGERDPEDDDA